ncbi:MAG: phosphatase PAP2 family protein [Alteromonadaceae bacterium]|nr:phosphatase PAP2 family protein [Alteromonadaceae bacterium]
MPALKMTTASQRWLITLVIFIAVLTTAELFDLKFLFANALYRLEGGQWSLKHHFITETIFHEGARNLNLIAVISLLALTLFQFFPGKNNAQRRRYVLLLLSILLSFGLVNYLKATLGMDCPWDLRVYGGTKPYFSLWSLNDSPFSSGRCFPSGHSSIGFAWIGLYFFWRKNQPVLANTSAVFSLFVGFTLGFAQQLRGAHFFVDDITTAFICWSIALLIFHIGEHHETTDT